MRILLIHNRYQSRGGEDVVFEQEFTALSESCVVEKLEFQNKKGISGLLQFMLYPFNFLAAWKVWQKVRRFKPEIVHVHNTHYASGPVVLWIVQKMGIPVVQTLHNYRMLCPSALLLYRGEIYTESIGKSFPWDAVKKGVLDDSRLKSFWTAFTYWLHKTLGTWEETKVYQALSYFSKKLLLESKYGLKENQIVVKPNFVPQKSINLNLVKGDHFVYVGRLSEEKGVYPLLSIFEKSDIPLRIIGDGPLHNEVKNYVEKNENIEYVGFQDSDTVFREISKAKCLIMPSINFEGGFTLVLVEAMMAKTLILASDIGAVPEYIKKDITGFLFRPKYTGDSKEIVNSVSKIADSEYKVIVDNAYMLYEDNFSEEVVMKKQLEIYGCLLVK